ncbi:hypothetical protein ACWD25_04005 [Streptomyces sp. NPDC002920]
MDFNTALNSVIADLTPQPWDHTIDGTTLRVIPAGLRMDPGCGEVLIRITQPHVTGLYAYGITGPNTKGAAEARVSTTDLPTLIGALEQHAEWDYRDCDWADLDRVLLTVGLELTITEAHSAGGGEWIRVTESMRLPEAQRLPLASALQRALDVARGWED